MAGLGPAVFAGSEVVQITGTSPAVTGVGHAGGGGQGCTPQRRLVIGLGNPDRGDDAAGRLAAQRLRRLVPGAAIIEQTGDAAALLETLQTEQAVWLIDAACSGAVPGTVHRIDCGNGEMPPASTAASTHGMGVAEAIALARALGCLPRRCVVYAIEGGQFAPGAPVSETVRDAAETVALRIAAELQTANRPR